MSSFDEYYKKWKKEKGVTADTSYRNLTNEQKVQEALKDVDEIFENYMSNNITNKQKQILNSNQENSNLNIFNNSKNTSNMLKQDTYRNQSIWDKVNNLAFGNRTTSYKENNKRNTINYTQEKTTNNSSNKTIWDTVNQKGNQISSNNSMLYANNNMPIIPIEREKQEKNKDLWKDVKDLAGLVMLGTSSGSKQTLNYIESANEKIFSNYKNIKEQQFLTSNNVSEEDKALAKSQNNPLLQMNGINIDNKIETNLVKKAIRESIAKDEQEIAKTQDRISNPIIGKLGEIAPSMGQMIPGTVLNALTPGAGISYFVPSAGGGYINDALNRGMSEEQAFKYGSIMGLLEGASDSFITGQQVNKVSNAFNGKQVLSKKVLDSYGFNIFENAFQESIMEPAQEITAGIIGDKADWSNMRERMLQSGFNGALMGAISNGVTYGLEKSSKLYNKIKSGESIIPQEYKDALRENINKFGKEKVEESFRKGSTDVYDELNNVVNNQQNTQNQLLVQEQNNIASNANMEPIHSNYNETAKKYNIDINNNTVKGMYEVASKRGINIYYDDTVFSSSKQNAKWAIDSEGNRTVVINPNSNTNTTLQSIMIHELTHDIEGSTAYSKINEMVLNKLKQADNYDNMMLDIANTYKNEYTNMSKEEFSKMIEQEAVADYLGENLGNQEFVNELVKSQDKNTIQKIMDWVKNKITSLKNTVTGNQETNYWKKIKENFEKAYNQEFQRNDIVEKFSIQTDSNGNQYVKVDTDQDIFEGINKKDYNKIAKMYMQDYLLGNTKLSNNDNTIIDSRSANKYTNPKQQTQYMNEKMQLTPELKNVLEIAQKDSISLPTKENSKYRSWEYYKFNFELGRKQFEGTVNIGIDKDGNKHFYEINKIHTTSNSSVSTNKSSSMDSINNSILSTKEDVNRNTTKYSMQESENNSGSFNLPINKESKQTNGNWQEYLKDTSINKGTRETMQDVKIPIIQKVQADINLKKFKEKNGIKNDIITEKIVPISENIEQEKVAKILSKSPEHFKESDRKWAIFKSNILDKGIVFEELSHKTKNRELQSKWDYTLSATARGQNAIGNSRYEFNSKTKEQIKICKSLEEIRVEVGENANDFSNYMYHQLNIDRMTLQERFDGDTGINYERKNTINNKPVFGESITAKMSQEVVKELERKYPKFKEYAQDIYDFLNANKAELVKNGVISQKTSDHMAEMYPHYVPIGRANTKGMTINVPLDTGKTGINSPIKSAKGGSSDILPLFDTIAQRTLQTYRASARNNFGIELKNTLNTVSNREQASVDNIIDTMGQTIEDQDLLQEGKNGNNPTFTVFENGEKITYEITKDMYDALKPVGDSSILGKTITPLNKISNFRRGVLTEYNPLFMVTNAIKDAQDVLINSQHSAKTYSKFPEAYAQITKKGYWYQEYIQNGGEQNSYFNANDNIFESDVKQSKTKSTLKIPLDVISNINNVIELAPRLSEYIASRELGRSIETSMLDASRVTTNFKAGGDITKFANRNGATFLNASVQGMMQQVRNITEANTKGLKGYAILATKYTVAGLPALILNNLVWHNDKDYEELQDYVKDNYYCIAKLGDGKFIRIPKGRMLSTIQTMVSNASGYITGDKEINIDNFASDFWEDIQSVMDNVAPNNPLDNNVLSPIFQAMSNTSWYGEDIVPSRLQDKPKKEQYDETTDSLSIWLGKKLNISPYKINYLLDQYGGGISDVALPLMTKQAENNPIEDKFTTDSIMKSKYAGNLFETADKLKINANSSNATDEDKIKYKYISNIQSDLSDLYTKKREIQNSNASDKAKKVQLKEIQKQINKIAKVGVESLDNLKLTNNTAIIGDNQYYKSTNLKTNEKEWKELSEEEKEKNKNIRLKTYTDYKEKISLETIKQRKNGTIKENGQLKSKDKINILLNSNYSEKEKKAIYNNYINNEDKKIILVDKLDFPLEQYLKYKQQGFKSEKDDEGESISGSKKKKVYNYLNEIDDTDLSLDYKKVICKIEGISSYDKDIVNFVNSQNNLTKTERIEILKNIGFKVDKEGRIKTTTMLPLTRFVK